MPAIPGLRSPYETVGGLFGFGRTLDKIKLFAAGKLPADYHSLLGDKNPQSLDARGCSFLRIRYADLTGRVKQGGSDEEILDWAFKQGRRPSEENLEIFNAFMRKRGWHDQTTAYLNQVLAKCGIPSGTVMTFPDLMDFDEQRPLRYPPDPVPPRLDFSGTISLPGLRSPYDTVGGIVHFGRMIDKIHLARAGKLPSEWGKFRGGKEGFDSICCRFLEVDYTELEREAMKGRSDEELLAWAFEHGRKPSDDEIEMFNSFLLKRGWRDAYSERLHFRLKEAGLPLEAALTMADFIDLDEGRPSRFVN